MSVPPVMIKRIVGRLIESGVYDYKKKIYLYPKQYKSKGSDIICSEDSNQPSPYLSATPVNTATITSAVKDAT